VQDEIHPPSDKDRIWLRQAEDHILQVLRQRYGDVTFVRSEADLRLLQRLLDDEVVRPDQVLELQCMGVVLGNVFDKHTSLRWSVVANEFGTQLSLHEPEKGFTMYPLTMISKRVSAERSLEMVPLFRSFVDSLGVTLMPAWISIYCKQPLDDVTPARIMEGVRVADFHTLAEQYDVAESLVKPARARLRIETVDGDGSPALRLCYRPEGERQLAIHFWTSPSRVQEEIEEALERIQSKKTAGARTIRKHLGGVKAVVGIEIGFSQLEDMGIVFAYEVARWFGEHKSGLIYGEQDAWSLIEDNCFRHL